MEKLSMELPKSKPKLLNPYLMLILANVPLIGFAAYVHYSLTGLEMNSSIWDNVALLILYAFKIGGANIILIKILFDPSNKNAFHS